MGRTLEGLVDPMGGTGDLLRLEVGAVYLISVSCLVVKEEAFGVYGWGGILISKTGN